MEMLTDKDENGEYVIPRILYSDAYSREMVACADLILPDAAAVAIRRPVIEPDRDVRGFQSILVD